MKVIEMDDVILSLENVKKVSFHEDGTGSQRNPYYYWIKIEYMNGETASSPCIYGGNSQKKVKDWFNDIFDLLALD